VAPAVERATATAFEFSQGQQDDPLLTSTPTRAEPPTLPTVGGAASVQSGSQDAKQSPFAKLISDFIYDDED
jgi:hypothetical protein